MTPWEEHQVAVAEMVRAANRVYSFGYGHLIDSHECTNENCRWQQVAEIVMRESQRTGRCSHGYPKSHRCVECYP